MIWDNFDDGIFPQNNTVHEILNSCDKCLSPFRRLHCSKCSNVYGYCSIKCCGPVPILNGHCANCREPEDYQAVDDLRKELDDFYRRMGLKI